MTRETRLLFGPLAASLLTCGIAGLALFVPGYSHVHQTVSEIGEVGSPAQIPFTILLCSVAVCVLVFASGVRSVSLAAGRSPFAAYVIACAAISAAGVGIFSFPHPLHNVFGLSEIVGYQAPLAVALTWRRDTGARSLVTVSWIFFALVWIALALNMSPMDRHGELWTFVHPVYGLVQRSLFATWFGWCAVAGVMLYRRGKRSS